MAVKYPDALLEVRTCCLKIDPPLTTLCAGYDGSYWRHKALADHLFQWIPYVALSQENQLNLGSHNFLEMLQLAAAHIYNTKKTKSRGELGEILLHIACIQHFKTLPIICKLILKTSSNDTVKGFDGIHLLTNGEDIEVWLGESKFYKNPKSAIKDAVTSIKQHIAPSFLETEKAMVFGHIAEGIPKREEVIKLFKRQTSGDELLKLSVFPVLIAYESKTVSDYDAICDEYTNCLIDEVNELREMFNSGISDLKLRFQLIFVPLGDKGEIIKGFDKKLEAFL